MRFFGALRICVYKGASQATRLNQRECSRGETFEVHCAIAPIIMRNRKTSNLKGQSVCDFVFGCTEK